MWICSNGSIHSDDSSCSEELVYDPFNEEGGQENQPPRDLLGYPGGFYDNPQFEYDQPGDENFDIGSWLIFGDYDNPAIGMGYNPEYPGGTYQQYLEDQAAADSEDDEVLGGNPLVDDPFENTSELPTDDPDNTLIEICDYVQQGLTAYTSIVKTSIGNATGLYEDSVEVNDYYESHAGEYDLNLVDTSDLTTGLDMRPLGSLRLFFNENLSVRRVHVYFSGELDFTGSHAARLYNQDGQLAASVGISLQNIPLECIGIYTFDFGAKLQNRPVGETYNSFHMLRARFQKLIGIRLELNRDTKQNWYLNANDYALMANGGYPILKDQLDAITGGLSRINQFQPSHPDNWDGPLPDDLVGPPSLAGIYEYMPEWDTNNLVTRVQFLGNYADEAAVIADGWEVCYKATEWFGNGILKRVGENRETGSYYRRAL